jgi:GntR family transcriptional regulator of gluconate operon
MRGHVIKTIKREGLGSKVAAELRAAIAGGHFASGERLIEIDLADRFGVSRGPIRDAFRMLESEGLIESQTQGMVVVGIALEDVNELYSLRSTIEEMAIRLLVGRRAQVSFEAMEMCVSRMQKAADEGDPTGFSVADVAFHNEIYRLSGHRRLADVWQQYEPIMMTLLRLTVSNDQDLNMATDRHRFLLDLIKNASADAVAADLVEHLEGSRQRMVKVWEVALERQRPLSA